MNRRTQVRSFVLAVVLTAVCARPAAAAERPNILWISCEDISPSLGCYGDAYAQTPNLDRLASEGVMFRNCFAHAGVCAVVRSGIITGMYPVSIGSQHMRSRIVPPPHVKCFPEYLRAAGYYCTNRSKTDYNFDAPRTAWDRNDPRHRDWEGRAAGQPFFSVINLTGTHESQIRAKFDELSHDPAEAPLPPYIPDTPAARRDWARYYDIITDMDRQTGEILARLEADGLAENTVVFFWGDHGQGLPRGKRWLYDSGTHVPLMVRWPGRIAPAGVREDLVCFLDLAPTVLSIAGVRPPDHLHGQVILGDQQGAEQEYVFGHRDRMDEAYDLIRAVRDGRYRYIRNFMPERTYAQNINYMNEMPTMQDLRRLHAAGGLDDVQELWFRPVKPVEELFDLQSDPHEVHNLAADPAQAANLARLRSVLEQWQEEVGDLGLVPEPLLTEEMSPGGQWEITATPRIGVAAAGAVGHVRVSLTCPTEGASIAWRVEGVTPREEWKLYAEPFDVPAGRSLKAVACRLGFKDSSPLEQVVVAE